MAKRVKLTRKLEDDTVVEEIVVLLSDEDLLWVKDDIKKENIPTGTTVEAFLGSALVFFEDFEGVFGIDPKNILKIEDEKRRSVGQ